MNDRFAHRIAGLAVAATLGLTASVPAAPPAAPEPAAESLTYTPPAWPEPPSAGLLLLRLVMVTGAVLALGSAAGRAFRRYAARQPAGVSDPRLRLLETLPLGNGGSLHLLECCGRRFVAGVSHSGLRSLAPLPEAFENELDVLTSLT
jgi:flagellar biogenesis protein FliO